jgi:hypothetical protein
MRSPPRIDLLADGFTLRGAKKEGTVDFSAVSAIHAQKADLFTVDEIWVTFEQNGGETVSISEEWSGYEELMKTVLTRFPECDALWMKNVVLPPFAPCPIVIWKELPNKPAQPATTTVTPPARPEARRP